MAVAKLHLNPNSLKSNLPIPTKPLIGREFELAEIKRLLLDPHYRLPSLTGSDGVGKTRLAQEAGREL